MAKSNQITGNVGMYYACYQLSKLGLNVMPTARNAKGADILAYTPDQQSFRTLQVKAMSRLTNISLGKSLDTIDCDWWLIVVDVYEDAPTTYVMDRDQVKKTAKLYDDRYWAQGSGFDSDESRNRWDRIISELGESSI